MVVGYLILGCIHEGALMGLLCLYLSGKRFGSLSRGEDGRLLVVVVVVDKGNRRYTIFYLLKREKQGQP